mmetsp:Transcript_13106/g.36875  ORF Transcript_13106/g.36875 Transcript_13106/m.36875 type:complete len:272 (-) Transcript_13106:301-1116(-)
MAGRWARALVRSSSADGPVYAVFGATGGIGQSLCDKLLAQAEAKVAVIVRSEEKASELQSILTQKHPGVDSGRFLPVIADALDPKMVDASIRQIVKEFGRVDGVTSCVGSILLKPAHATSDKEFMDIMNTNLVTSFNILKPSVQAMMKSGGGSIVFCSSAVARHGLMNHEAIAAAKAGVSGLALSAAATYAPKNIRINCVAPGLTRTPLSERITSNEAMLKASAAMHALKRVGEAHEVAAALEFLLHPSNSFITGQILGVDGGLGSIRSSG